MKNNIKIERAIAKMTQQQLAEAVSVSRQTINTIEAGKYTPSTELAIRIARKFKKPVEEIFFID